MNKKVSHRKTILDIEYERRYQYEKIIIYKCKL